MLNSTFEHRRVVSESGMDLRPNQVRQRGKKMLAQRQGSFVYAAQQVSAASAGLLSGTAHHTHVVKFHRLSYAGF